MGAAESHVSVAIEDISPLPASHAALHRLCSTDLTSDELATMRGQLDDMETLDWIAPSGELVLFELVRNARPEAVFAFLHAGTHSETCKPGDKCRKSLTWLSDDGVSAASLAVWRGDESVLKSILESDATLHGVPGHNLYHVAAHKGFATGMDLLLDAGYEDGDVNGVSGEGWTPLMFSASRGHLDVVQLLLELDASPHMSLYEGNVLHVMTHVPSHYYSGKGSIDTCCKALKTGLGEEKGAIIPDISAYQRIVDLLLERGLPVDDRNGQEQTPLLCAVQRHNIPFIRILLARGADIHAVDANNEGVASYIGQKGEEGEDLHTLLHTWCDTHAG
jgi:ankyrin repeat protein